MKKIICVLLLLIVCKSHAQKAEERSYFVVLYTISAGWDTTKQFHEQVFAAEHSDYLSKLRKEKTIVMGARYSDTGMIIIKAKNETEAREITGKDPAIQNNLFKTQVFFLNRFMEVV
ncbi:MAG: hypothetical protein K0S33_773 [Bacteroidetes bacterium]|jgi:uncharacterized protein YciI|nr:hypothetical protein [Bacteroidota bacterium]